MASQSDAKGSGGFPKVTSIINVLKKETLNKIFTTLKALTNMSVSPDGMGSLKIGDSNSTLDLNPMFQGGQQTIFVQLVGGNAQAMIGSFAVKDIQPFNPS